jgi:hypothetical protein
MPARSYYDLIAQLLGESPQPDFAPGWMAGLGPVGSSAQNPYIAPPLGGAGTLFPPASGLQFNPQVPLDMSQVHFGSNPWWGFVGQGRLPYYDPLPQYQQDPFATRMPLGSYGQPPTNYPYGENWDQFYGPPASGGGAY